MLQKTNMNNANMSITSIVNSSGIFNDSFAINSKLREKTLKWTMILANIIGMNNDCYA